MAAVVSRVFGPRCVGRGVVAGVTRRRVALGFVVFGFVVFGFVGHRRIEVAAFAAVGVVRRVLGILGGLALALGGARLGEQRFAIGDRDAVVVGMDLVEGEEAVPIAAVLDERRLQRRFDPRHLGEIDVALKLLFARALEVEFVEAIAVEHDHPGLLRMGRVDQHTFDHLSLSPTGARAVRRNPDG